MDIRKVRKLIELLQEYGINEIEVKEGEESVRITRGTPVTAHYSLPPAGHPMIPHESSSHAFSNSDSSLSSEPNGHSVKSPMVGTVFLAPTPGAPPFVTLGQRVSIGDTLCIIEAMKMFNQITADRAGVLSARLVENEQPVEYEQVLFIIESDE